MPLAREEVPYGSAQTMLPIMAAQTYFYTTNTLGDRVLQKRECLYSEPCIQRIPYTTNPWIQQASAMGTTLTNSSETASLTTNPWIQRTICQGIKGFVVSKFTVLIQLICYIELCLTVPVRSVPSNTVVCSQGSLYRGSMHQSLPAVVMALQRYPRFF